MTDILSNALGSATAGFVSRCLTHPLDTAKARLQAGSQKTYYYTGSLDVLKQTIKTEGLGGLYRGFSAVVIGGTPGTILYLCSYDIIKQFLNDKSTTTKQPKDSFLIHFTSGMLAESLACIVYVPVDVVKERMQVQHTTTTTTMATTYGAGNHHTIKNYKSSWDALVQISRNEGLAGIYRGYGATLASFGPFSALYFVFYEQFKLSSKEYLNNKPSSNNHDDDLPLPWIILSSASAGALASWMTSPLDMAKLRLQVQRGNNSHAAAAAATTTTTSVTTVSYRGMLDCLQHAYSQNGVSGLFRGAGARVLHFIPATTITMTCYETFRSSIFKVLSE